MLLISFILTVENWSSCSLFKNIRLSFNSNSYFAYQTKKLLDQNLFKLKGHKSNTLKVVL